MKSDYQEKIKTIQAILIIVFAICLLIVAFSFGWKIGVSGIGILALLLAFGAKETLRRGGP